MKTENTLPNFLIIGAAKCGTTSLYHYLRQHPEVYMSPIKEPNHFSTDIDPQQFSKEYKLYERSKQLNVSEYVKGDMKEEKWGAYVHDISDYTQLFKYAAGFKARGEISNSYLYSIEAAKNIRQRFPDMKIIAILRQPAERAYSHYLANLRDGRTTLPFREEIQFDDAKAQHGWGISHLYYELGLYYDQITRFKNLFEEHQIKIFLFDELKNDNKKLSKDLFQFLEIKTDTPINYSEKYNEARIPKNAALIKTITQTGIKRKIFRALPVSLRENVKSLFFKSGPIPKMSPQDREWMTDRYKQDILKLQDLIQKDLTNWLK